MNEVREYNTGPLITPFSGATAHYTPVINGTILSVYYDQLNLGALDGGVFVRVSGTGELIASYEDIQIGVDKIDYPISYGSDNQMENGSPWTKINRVVNGPLLINTEGTVTASRILSNIKIKYV